MHFWKSFPINFFYLKNNKNDKNDKNKFHIIFICNILTKKMKLTWKSHGHNKTSNSINLCNDLKFCSLEV